MSTLKFYQFFPNLLNIFNVYNCLNRKILEKRIILMTITQMKYFEEMYIFFYTYK